MKLKALSFTLACLILVGCPNGKNSTSGNRTGVPTFRDLFKNVSHEERNLLEEACRADQNSARCRRAVDPNFVNDALHAPTERRTEQCEACREHKVQTVRSESSDDWKPGCEVLEGGVESADEAKLQQCMNSIKAAITTGAGRNREKIYCNMYNILRPEEQHFAGMVFTSIGEAGILSDSGKWQENLFVMNAMDNRIHQARSHNKGGGRFEVNALDVALAPWQFSMYNEGYLDWEIFNPAKPSTHRQSMAIKAFISISNDKDKIQPKPDADNIRHYYSPTGMEKANQATLVASLKETGMITQDHPADRKVPDWIRNNGKLTRNTTLNIDGVAPTTTLPKHVFYRANNDDSAYGVIPNEFRSGASCKE